MIFLCALFGSVWGWVWLSEAGGGQTDSGTTRRVFGWASVACWAGFVTFIVIERTG